MLTIDINSPRPLEEQLVIGIHKALASGEIGPGDELPSVRQLAGDLGIHWNTVARAYRRLADDGLAVVRRGRSTIIREHAQSKTPFDRAELRERFAEAVAAALVRGLSRQDITSAFREALADLRGRTR